MELRVEGIVKNTSSWVFLTSVEVAETATEKEVNEGAEEFRNLIGAAFKGGTDGYVTLGDVVINIQSYAAISVKVMK